MLLAAVTSAAVLAMLPFTLFLTSANQSSLFQLLLGVVALATQSVVATGSIGRALRRGRRLRAAAARHDDDAGRGGRERLAGSNGNLAGIP